MDLEPVGHEPVTLRALGWGLSAGALGLGIGGMWLLVAIGAGGPGWLPGVLGLAGTTGAVGLVGFVVGTIEASLALGGPGPGWLTAVGRGAVNAGNWGSLTGAALAAPAAAITGSIELAVAVWSGLSVALLGLGAASAALRVRYPTEPLAAAALVLRWTALSAATGALVTSLPALLAVATRLVDGRPEAALAVALAGPALFATTGLVAGLLDAITRPQGLR